MKPRYLIPALLCFLLVAYPLSFGPVARYHRASSQNRPATRAIMTIYGPLFRLGDICRPLGNAFQAYVKLWLPPEAKGKLKPIFVETPDPKSNQGMPRK